MIGWLVGNAVFLEMALRIFLIFCMKSGDYKGRKVTELDFGEKKSWLGDIYKKVSKLALVGWLVHDAVFSVTALRIFMIFCMKLGDYKGRKVTKLDFWKKFLIWRYLRKGLQISPKTAQWCNLTFWALAQSAKWNRTFWDF